MPSTAPLETPVETLHSTSTTPLPFQQNVMLRSFWLRRPAGNVLVYNSPGISESAQTIDENGGATRLLVNHEHESMFGQPDLDVPVFVHERDRAATARSLPVTCAFDHRQMLNDDLEVIPTPGHTPGTTSYLWDSGVHRFLFTGDFIWLEHGEWKAVVLDPGMRQQYLDSLALIRDLDFDILVPWGATDDGPCFAMTDRSDTRDRIDAIISRVRTGQTR